MTFYSNFSDIAGKRYEVEIYVDNQSGDEINLTLSDKPCVIKTGNSALFSPVKSRSCQINIISHEWYLDLYEPSSRGTSVKVYEYDEEAPLHVGRVLFKGFLTPCAYDQTFTYMDEITLNAVDGISTAKEYKWDKDLHQYMTFFNIIMKILKPCGYKNLYIPCSYDKINGNSLTDTALHYLYASSDNFVDDDDEHTPWTEYEIIEEIMQFMGWTLCPDGEDVWLIDYKAEVAETNDNVLIYKKYSITDSSFIENVQSTVDPVELGLDITSAGTANVSIDDIYNKISISDNLYEIEDISPDVTDDGVHISVTDEAYLGYEGSKWTRTETKGFLWWKDTTTKVTGQQFQTLCRFNPTSGWTHHFYKMNEVGTFDIESPNESIEAREIINNSGMWKGKNYHDPTLTDSNYTRGINGVVNTHGCLLQHYAFLKNEGKNKIPVSVDWTDVLTFFVANDCTPKVDNYDKMRLFELPVLEYRTQETVNWKPASGTSWITIKGDLYYQYNGASYDDNSKLTIINTDTLYYDTAPVDKAVSIDAQNLYGIGRSESSSEYNKGFSVWKMKLEVGGKYWNGSSWQTTECTFYIKYNDDPDDGNREAMAAFGWMGPVNNTSYKDKTGVDGYCIPIAWDDNNAPVMGKLHLTIYTPTQISSELIEILQLTWPRFYTDITWARMVPVIYCKDFELGYVYTDTNVWYNNHENENKADKVYVGYINDNYVQDFSDLEFKLNTALVDKPISRSFVTTESGYLSTMKHKYRTESKAQEYNVIDLYLDHHSDRKPIYETNLKTYYHPNVKFINNHLEDEKFVINTQAWDIAARNNRITLISF